MKSKEEKYSIFEYNPNGNILYFRTNETLYYNFDSFEFELDRNPLGDPLLSRIYNVNISSKFDCIKFDTIIKKKEKHITINCCNRSDINIIKLFSVLQNKPFCVNDNDFDRIIICVDNDMLDKIQIYKKNKNEELLDSLRIKREGNFLFIEKFRPYIKSRIELLTIDDKDILVRTTEKDYKFRLDVQNVILNCIKSIMVDNGFYNIRL